MLLRSSRSRGTCLAFACCTLLGGNAVWARANDVAIGHVPPRGSAASARPLAVATPTAAEATHPGVTQSRSSPPTTSPDSPASEIGTHAQTPAPASPSTSVTPATVPMTTRIAGRLPRSFGSVGDGGGSAVGISAKDGLYARSDDGSFSLKVGTLLQTRVSLSSTPDPSRKIEFVPVVARLYAQGSLGAPWLKFYLQPEFAGQQSPEPVVPIPPAPRLLDAWVEAQPSVWLGVRLGIMRPLFGRSWINGLQRSLMFDRSDANLFFRTHGPIPEVSGANVQPTLAWDRDIGITILGTPLDGVLEYSLGVYNGNGPWFGRNGDQWVMPMARLAVSPLGSMGYDETQAVSKPEADWKFQVGVGAYANRYRVDYVNPGLESGGSEEQRTLEADVTLGGTGVYISVEGYLRSRRLSNDESAEERGATGLAGWMFWAPHLEAVVRLSYIDPNRDVQDDLRRVYETQLNYYHWGNSLKLGLRYGWSNNQAPVLGGVPGALMTIAPGTSLNTVTVWTQLYF